MKVAFFLTLSRFAPLFLLPLVLPVFLSGCHRFSPNLPVTPPATHPLVRQHIGYGVVNVSFAHLLSEPHPGGESQGHLRRGTVLRVIERRHIINPGSSESWVLAEENFRPPEVPSRGWLPETVVEIFDRESRANTASRAMGP
ncbi:MAG: hypothetical protein FWC64_10780 [Treponema sp.]|nr:hypothetical protein [Treponema sp.]